MDTFKITLTYTFIGNYAECRRKYEDRGSLSHKELGLTFFDWCEASLDKAVNRPYQSPPDDVEEILTEEYLTSLGWAKIDSIGLHHKYSRLSDAYEEFLMFSVWPDKVLVDITHKIGNSYNTGVFSGKIDSRQTFEIILNAVS